MQTLYLSVTYYSWLTTENGMVSLFMIIGIYDFEHATLPLSITILDLVMSHDYSIPQSTSIYDHIILYA